MNTDTNTTDTKGPTMLVRQLQVATLEYRLKVLAHENDRLRRAWMAEAGHAEQLRSELRSRGRGA